MNDILLATIPAALVLVATLGARFVEHYLQSRRETESQKLEKEREIRDAIRKYRENIVVPIKGALTKLRNNVEWSKFIDTAHEAMKIDSSLETEVVQELEKSMESMRGSSTVKTLTETIPLIATITNEDTREFLRRVFLEIESALYLYTKKEVGRKLYIADEDIRGKLNLAYQKLEDYVALAY